MSRRSGSSKLSLIRFPAPVQQVLQEIFSIDRNLDHVGRVSDYYNSGAVRNANHKSKVVFLYSLGYVATARDNMPTRGEIAARRRGKTARRSHARPLFASAQLGLDSFGPTLDC